MTFLPCALAQRSSQLYIHSLPLCQYSNSERYLSSVQLCVFNLSIFFTKIQTSKARRCLQFPPVYKPSLTVYLCISSCLIQMSSLYFVCLLLFLSQLLSIDTICFVCLCLSLISLSSFFVNPFTQTSLSSLHTGRYPQVCVEFHDSTCSWIDLYSQGYRCASLPRLLCLLTTSCVGGRSRERKIASQLASFPD